MLVLGCGIQTPYLAANAPLREEVAKCGALISEYPPKTQPSVSSFPQRNRIISGISDAVLIVQAGDRSGTLNTASHAKRQGKPLFVVPGPITSSQFAGSNRLIREGAKPSFSAEEIFSHFDMVYALQDERQADFSFPSEQDQPTLSADAHRSANQPQPQTASAKRQIAPAPAVRKPDLEAVLSRVSKNAGQVYCSIIDGNNQMDEIVLSVALPTAKVLSALTELELFGLISKGEGNYYSVNDTDAVF